MAETLTDILDALEALVGFDTQNPPRPLDASSPLFGWLRNALPGFDVTCTDHGDGCVNFLAKRGAPRILFNVHLDTVPATDAWTQKPFALQRGQDRCVGLGACDIKGAAAALIVLARQTDAPMALLFSTDEEAGQGRCIKRYLETRPDFDRVVVGEPTSAQAVAAHRGIVSGALGFTGAGAHASTPLAKKNNAVHKAVEWGRAALDLARDNPLGDDYRLNIGVIEGGVKPNMSAPACTVRFGLRPPAGVTPETGFEQFTCFGEIASKEIRFAGPGLPAAAGADAQAAIRDSEAFAQSVGLALGAPVDFWTEAALFSAAGLPAVVLGPGDIAQAHTADEWVAYDQLLGAFDAYGKVVAYDRQ